MNVCVNDHTSSLVDYWPGEKYCDDMNLILLGGNSPTNKQWLHDLATVLKTHLPSSYIHHYRHWETGEELIDLDYELEVLTKNLPAVPYIVLAKSAGVLLTLKGVAEKLLSPQKCIFLGTPILWAKGNHFAVDSWLNNYSLPTLFIQQAHDPAMSFNDLKQYLEQGNIKYYQFFEVPGDDHVYGNFDQLKDPIITFITNGF